jgi:4-hydroxy-tetrahydrodipicolinate reductase
MSPNTAEPIRICVAGATGWTGMEVVKEILSSKDFELSGAIARNSAGEDIGRALGLPATGIHVTTNLAEAAKRRTDVLVDYTSVESVKPRVQEALRLGLHVVIGTSGLSPSDFSEIEQLALSLGLGVIAAGNFSITAALSKHLALIAAQYLPTWEIIDYAQADKPDAPSSTARELAEAMHSVRHNAVEVPVEQVHGYPEARGATIEMTQVHSVRLPNYAFAFETIFGLPGQSLTIRHDAGASAHPYVHGTLLAARKVMGTVGLVRGFDNVLFG